MSRVKKNTLLFLHGGSYTKECWNPIIGRLQASPLLQRVPCDVVNFDWRFHGEKSDHSVPATLAFLDGDQQKPRVLDHPLREWTQWGHEDVRRHVRAVRERERDANIVAIGHSMGATTLLQVEIATPGTFQGLVAFEPVHKWKDSTPESRAAMVSTLVSITSARPGSWSTWDEVRDHFMAGKMYRRWDRECMDAFLEQGVRRSHDGKYVLATTPLQEAAVYCHTQLDLDFARVGCPVTIEHAEKSCFFNPKDTEEIADKFPDKFRVADAIPNTIHSMVVEDPDTCAAHILENLSRLAVFQ